MKHHTSWNLSLSEIYFSNIPTWNNRQIIVKSYPLHTFDKHSEVRHCECTTDCSHKWTDIHNVLSWKTHQLELCFTITDICCITVYFHLKLTRFWQFHRILMPDLFRKVYSCRAVFISTMKAIQFLPCCSEHLGQGCSKGRQVPSRYPRGRAATLTPKTEHPKWQLLIHRHPISK